MHNFFKLFTSVQVLQRNMSRVARKKTAGFSLILVLLVIVIAWFANIFWQEFSFKSDSSSNSEQVSVGQSDQSDGGQVTSVADGDTIKVLIDGKTQTVRLANIDAPETVDPRKPVQCMGREASNKMSELVAGQQVMLMPDITQADRDRYNRLLRFVFLTDRTDVGLELIKSGYARSSPYGSSPHKYLEAYIAAEASAKAEELGLWNPSACQDFSSFLAPASSPTSSPVTASTNDSTSQPMMDGVVKKSSSGICHAPDSAYYEKTTNFASFKSIDECLASGGRLPR
jgi:endonuclease YncB( thermonuclease family)